MATRKRKRKLEKTEDENADFKEPKAKKRRVNKTSKSRKKSTNKNTKNQKKFVFILAHGAGTNSQHPNMQNWKKRLSKLGKVEMFDFKRPFNKMDKMVATYQAKIDSTLKKYGDEYDIVLIGTSMGSRVSIHLANNNSLPANCKLIIALGYPLFVKRKTGNTIREEPLLNFINSKDKQLKQTRLCLISGTKDFMAPKDVMNGFYDKVKKKKVGSRKKCELYWIDGGSHSLKIGKRHKLSQDEVDQSIIVADKELDDQTLYCVMYHAPSFTQKYSCSIDSSIFSCDYDELNILSAKYGAVLDDSFVSDLCFGQINPDNDFNDKYNQTLIQSFGDKIRTLQFHKECDITNQLNKYLSSTLIIDDIVIDDLLFMDDHHINMNGCNELNNTSWSYLFEISYICSQSHSHHHTHSHSDSHQRRLSDGDILIANETTYYQQSSLTSLHGVINNKFMNPSNPESTYWLCIIIISVLSILSICGCYYCCIQCIRCYQYQYFLCHCSCIYKCIKCICCCIACDEYNWFYKNINHEYNIKKEKTKQMNELYFKNITSGDYMPSIDYERGQLSQMNSIDYDQDKPNSQIMFRQTSGGTQVPFNNVESASSFNHRYKDRTQTVQQENINNNNRNQQNENNQNMTKDRLRISVHSTSSWNTLNTNTQMQVKETPLHNQQSVDNTPIPEENTINGINGNPQDTDNKTIVHNNNNNQTQTNMLPSTQRITFRSPASIELSPLSQGSHLTPTANLSSATAITNHYTSDNGLPTTPQPTIINNSIHDSPPDFIAGLVGTPNINKNVSLSPYHYANSNIGYNNKRSNNPVIINHHSLPPPLSNPKLTNEHRSSPNIYTTSIEPNKSTDDRPTHPKPQHNVTQSVTDLQSMTMDLKERELQTYNHSDDENEDRYGYNEHIGDAIMTSDNSNDGMDDEEDEDNDLLPNIDEIGTKSNKSTRSLSRRQSNKSYKSKRGRYRKSKLKFTTSTNDRDNVEGDEILPPKSTRVVFNTSKSNTKNDMIMLMHTQAMYEFEPAENTEHTINNDMANVVMVNYDSSPEMQLADNINNAVGLDSMDIEHNRSFKNDNPDYQWNKSRKSTDFASRLPDFVSNLSNRASNKSNKISSHLASKSNTNNGKSSRPSTPKSLRLKLKALTTKRKTRSDGESLRNDDKKSNYKPESNSNSNNNYKPSTAKMIAAFRRGKKKHSNKKNGKRPRAKSSNTDRNGHQQTAINPNLPGLRDDNSSGNQSPLKLVKAATWNGRSSEIIELFDVQNKANMASEPHPSFGTENSNENDNNRDDTKTSVGLYENDSGHIFSASLEQYPLASELKTIKEISHENKDNITTGNLTQEDEFEDDEFLDHFPASSAPPNKRYSRASTRGRRSSKWKATHRILTDTEDMTDQDEHSSDSATIEIADNDHTNLMSQKLISFKQPDINDMNFESKMNNFGDMIDSDEKNKSFKIVDPKLNNKPWREQLSFAKYIEMDDLVFTQCIGRGSNSKVFQGQWKQSTVCIKMYDKTFPFRKIRNEIRTFTAIGNHPHIVSVYGYTYDPKHNSFGLITQLMSHGSAAQAVRKQKFNIVPTLLMLKYAVKYLHTMYIYGQSRYYISVLYIHINVYIQCCGLLHLHDNGVLHRHFAARHILLDVSGKCCITNFAECITEKQLEHQTSNNDSYNFIATTPPEVMTNKTYTKKSDVYSFAIAAWEILTREIPFNGTQPIDAQIKIVKQNKRPPQMNIPDDIYLLLNKCWDLNPDNRPDLTDVAMELNAKLYKYRLLAKGHLMQRSGGGLSSGSSIQGPTSIYSAPTQLQPIQSNSATPGNDTQQAFKRPSLVPVKYNVSAPYPGQANVQRFSTQTMNQNASTDIKNQQSNNVNSPQITGINHPMSGPPNVPSLQSRNTDNHLLHSNYQRVSSPMAPHQFNISKLPQSHPQLQYHYTYNGPSPRPPSSAPNPTINISMNPNIHSPNTHGQPRGDSPVSRSSQRLRHASPPPMPLSSPNLNPNRNSNENKSPNNSNTNSKPNDHGTRNSTASPPPFINSSTSNNNHTNNSNGNNNNYNVSKTLYSQISPNNGPPPQPISPPPNNYNVTTSPAQMQNIINPANIILENINSQSVIQ